MAILDALIHLLGLGAVVLLWRDHAAAGAAAAALAFGAAGWASFRAKAPRPRACGARFLLAAALATTLIVAPDLWPCGVECTSAADYRTLFGWPVLGLGAACAGAIALVCFTGAAPLRWLAELAACAAAGGSLWFLWKSFDLGLFCRQCIAFHGLLLSGAAAFARGSTPRLLRIAAAGGGVALLPWLFALDLERAGPAATSAATRAAIERAGEAGAEDCVLDAVTVRASADAARRVGGGDPRLRVEAAISFECGRCGHEFGPLRDAMGSLAAEGVELVYRFVHAPKSAASVELLQLVFASGVEGRFEELTEAAFRVRGSELRAAADAGAAPPSERTGMDRMREAFDRYKNRDDLVLKRLREELDLSRESALIARHPDVFVELVAEERAALTRLGAVGELPQIFLVDPRTGQTLEKLDHHATVEKVTTAVRRHLRQR